MPGELGDTVRDRISGYEGTATCIATYLTGCNQIGIKPSGVKSDGGTYDTLYFDEPYVEVIKAGTFKPIPNRETGGPQAPMRRG